MEQLAQVTIDKVYKSKPIQGQHGEYHIYNFTVEGDNRKFSCIPNQKISTPIEGAEIPYMEFSHSTNTGSDGKVYDNYRVAEMKVMGGGTPNPQPNPKPAPPRPGNGRDSSLTMYISYAKDIIVALINQGRVEPPDTLCFAAVKLGKEMYDLANKVDSQPSQGSSMPQDEPPPYTDDQIPF